MGGVVAKVAHGVSEADLGPHVRKRVLPVSVVYTDDWGADDRLGKYVRSYLDEYVFRCNNREMAGGIVDAFLRRIAKTSPAFPDPS
jgi:hypothetical protein